MLGKIDLRKNKREPLGLIRRFALGAGLLLVTGVQLFSQTGMLFGDDYSFYMTAPPGWILDNKSGVPQGLHMVFYPIGFTLQNSPAFAYGRSITLTDDIQTIEDVVKSNIQNFKDNGHFNYSGRKEKAISLPGGKTAEVYYYSGDRWGNHEAVGYILERKTVNFLVFSCRTKKAFDGNIEKFYEILESYKNVNREDTEGYGEEQFKAYLKKAKEDSSSPEGKAYETLLGETQGSEIKRLFKECLAYEKNKSEIPDMDAVLVVEEDGTIGDSFVWPVTALSRCFKGAITSLKLPTHSLKQFHWHISLKFNVVDQAKTASLEEPAQTIQEEQDWEEGPRFLQMGDLPPFLFSIGGSYNPYEYWSWFKPKSFVAFRITSEVGGSKTSSRKKFEVMGLTRDHVSLQVEESMDADKTKSPMIFSADSPPWESTDLFNNLLSLNFSNPNLFLDADGITPGKEELEINGRPIETQRFFLTFEDQKVKTNITIWYADEIPGGVARYKREILAAGTSVLEETSVENFRAEKKTEAEFQNPGWENPAEIPASTYLGKRLHYFEDERAVDFQLKKFYKLRAARDISLLLSNITAMLEDVTRWNNRFEEDRRQINEHLSSKEMTKLEPFLDCAALYCQTILDYIAGQREILNRIFNNPETIDDAFKKDVEEFYQRAHKIAEVNRTYIAARADLRNIKIRFQN